MLKLATGYQMVFHTTLGPGLSEPPLALGLQLH